MALHLTMESCMLCRRPKGEARDKLHLDNLDEEGRRYLGMSLPWLYCLPVARFRDKIAPALCDQCWFDHRQDIVKRSTRFRGCCPPFHQDLLWEWVAAKLEDEAKRLGAEHDRLHPHLKEKATRSAGVVRKGPLRAYGPSKHIYRRGRSVA